MIDWIELKEHLQRGIIALAFLTILWSPVYGSILLLIGFLLKNNKMRKREYVFLLIVILVVCAIFFNLQEINYIFPTQWKSYLFDPYPFRMMCVVIVTLICVFFDFGSVDSWLVKSEKQRQDRIYSKDEQLEFNNRSHVFVCGTTGSGKTQLIERYIKDSLQKREPLYIVSGKSSNDSNSLLDDVIGMCSLYNRQLYIVSMNPRRLERVPYNPLKNCSVVEVADALTNASEFTEPHYKYHLSTWVKVVCEVMALAGVHYSLDSILFFMDFDNFSRMLNQLVKSKDISAEKAEKYASYKDIAQIASTSRARFLNILLGEGKEVIGDYRNISAEDVRKENAVLFLDLDSFKYTDFTQVIGALFINDMRHLISTEKDHNPKRIIMDELSCYVTEQIMPLFSQSRSFGYQLVVATQSIADIEQINEKLAVRIMENCGQYGVLQLNSADDAEAISRIIGTTIAVETTRKSAGTHLHPTADGSKKVVNTFKVTPDTIKELEPLEVIFYDKKQPHKIKRVKMEYGWEKPMGRGDRR